MGAPCRSAMLIASEGRASKSATAPDAALTACTREKNKLRVHSVMTTRLTSQPKAVSRAEVVSYAVGLHAPQSHETPSMAG